MTAKEANRNRIPEEWRKAYEEKYHVYEQFTDKLRKLISELLEENNIEVAQIESRTKRTESFVEKIRRGGKIYLNPLEEITDLVGIRIITYYKEDVDKIGEIIEKEFDIDSENSIDKAQTLDPDRFGYLSVHYVISLPASRKRLTEWKTFENIQAEIQVRTVLQHAWAAIDHKLRYKTAKEVPKSLRRKLFRLSALLELADDEFSNLTELTEKVEEKYSLKVKKGKLDIALDFSSFHVYFESTKHHIRWMKEAEQIGFQHFEESKAESEYSKSILFRALLSIGIANIQELNEILSDAHNWGKRVLADFLKASSEEGYIPHAFPYNLILILVFYARRDVVTDDIIEQTGFMPEVQKAIRQIIRSR